VATDYSALLEEVSRVRSEFVNGYVGSRINRREGDVTDEQVKAWENDAYRIWRSAHPALSDFLIPNRHDDQIPTDANWTRDQLGIVRQDGEL